MSLIKQLKDKGYNIDDFELEIIDERSILVKKPGSIETSDFPLDFIIVSNKWGKGENWNI